METALVPNYSLPMPGRAEDYATATIVKKLDISHLTRPYPATLDFSIQIIERSSTTSFRRVREIEAITGRSFFKLIYERQLMSLFFVLAFVKDVQGNCAMFDAFALKPWLEKQGTNPKTLAKVIQVSFYTIASLDKEFDFLEQSDSTFVDTFIRANGGDPDAQYELGRFYEEGLRVTKDKGRAEHFFHLSAKAGNVKALLRKLPQMIHNAAFDDIKDLFSRISVEEAVKVGVFYVDLFYEEKIDIANIRFEFLEAMNMTERQHRIAYLKAKCLQRGTAVSSPREEILRLLEFATQSCPKACYEIGFAAIKDQKFLMAESYLKRAGKDHILAQVLLAEIYRTPKFQKFKKALKILDRLNKQNVKEALVPLALMYLEGQGTAKNIPFAQSLLQKASEFGISLDVTLLKYLADPQASVIADANTKLQFQEFARGDGRTEKVGGQYTKPETSPRNLEGSGEFGSVRKVTIMLDSNGFDDLPPLIDPPQDLDDEEV